MAADRPGTTAPAQAGKHRPRHAVCVCVDRNMLVPGLFVLDAVRSRRSSPADHDLLLVTTGPGDTTDADRCWLAERGMLLRDDFDLSVLQGIEIAQSRLTKATLLKLLLAGKLAGRYDKILYLDADLTIHQPLAPLFSLDTNGHAFAAVPSSAERTGFERRKSRAHAAHCRRLGMTDPRRFVNSGVLLIDVGRWNRDDLGARALDFIRRHPALCQLPDEDALNGLLDGRVAELSPVWNLQAPLWSHREVRALVEPAIIHYIGANKPWKRFRRRKRLFEQRAAHRLYREFVKDSPWPGWLGEQWGARDLWDGLAFELSRTARKLSARKLRKDGRERREFLETYRRHCGEATFADVLQGIVRRDGVRLRVAGSEAPPRTHLTNPDRARRSNSARDQGAESQP
jgi:lipopolysaccharide biosynthesis glycosyltransferase